MIVRYCYDVDDYVAVAAAVVVGSGAGAGSGAALPHGIPLNT